MSQTEPAADIVKAQIRSTRGETIDLALPSNCTVGDLHGFLVEQYNYKNTYFTFQGRPVDPNTTVVSYPFGSLVLGMGPISSAPGADAAGKQGGPAPVQGFAPLPPEAADAVAANEDSLNHSSYAEPPAQQKQIPHHDPPTRHIHKKSSPLRAGAEGRTASGRHTPSQAHSRRASDDVRDGNTAAPTVATQPAPPAQRTPRGAPSAASTPSRANAAVPASTAPAAPATAAAPGAPTTSVVSPPTIHLTLTCQIPAIAKVVNLATTSDAVVSEIIYALALSFPEVGADAKMVFRGKVLPQLSDSRLFNFGIRQDSEVYIASGEFSNVDKIILMEIEAETSRIKDIVETTTLTDLQRKGYYEELMRVLFRTDGLQSLEGDWRMRRKAAVAAITAVQDQLNVDGHHSNQ